MSSIKLLGFTLILELVLLSTASAFHKTMDFAYDNGSRAFAY